MPEKKPRRTTSKPAQPTKSDRIRSLHRATLSLYADLTLEGTLRRIVQAARELTHARYAALGIPDNHGGLETFLTEGLGQEEVDAIAHPPVGRGLIGEMMRTSASVRLPDLSAHPRSAGFPEGHPPMKSFLGVPISAFGRPVGQLYLTDRIGAEVFSEEDQSLIEMLAAHAAAAIENARLYRQIRDREEEVTARNRELELVNSLATAVSSAMELDALLAEMLDRVIDLFDAQAGEVFLKAEDEKAYGLAVHRGRVAEAFWAASRFRVGEGFVGRVAASGKAAWTTQLGDAEETHRLQPSVLASGIGTMVSVPLKARAQVVGVMSLAFRGNRPLRVGEIGLLEALGAAVGVAVENARLYRQARRVAVLEERERIAMELHDGIIQSIYAIGLTLDSLKTMEGSDREERSAALARVIEGLNAVIRDIRTYILDLQPSRVQMDDFGGALRRLTNEFRANTTVETELLADPKVAETISDSVRLAMFHISQEALANTAKHAQASRVWVSLRREDGDAVLQVIDNGRGFPADEIPTRLGHGLSNIVERARGIGAQVEIASSPGEGTTVTVRLPLDSE
ncbi:MAG TPA: GAF domain-containing sensor histidine kinase [Anaerolineales bacterium]|nr:GAF domain-containing sensor histidine kinase [Anaerolineales bacterium]